MKDKAQGWVDKSKNGKLQRRFLWFLLGKQFWPKVRYGLCGNTANFVQLEDCIQKEYWQIIPLGGIIRSVPKSIRQVDEGFYGSGCPHLVVGSLVEQLNKLLMHYVCRTCVGLIHFSRFLGWSRGILQTSTVIPNISAFPQRLLNQPASPGVLQEIWFLDHGWMVQKNLGESRYVWDNSGGLQYPSTPTKKRIQVDDDGIEAQRVLGGISTPT